MSVETWYICPIGSRTELHSRPRVVETGIAHGTVTVLMRGHAYEVTTPVAGRSLS